MPVGGKIHKNSGYSACRGTSSMMVENGVQNHIKTKHLPYTEWFTEPTNRVTLTRVSCNLYFQELLYPEMPGTESRMHTKPTLWHRWSLLMWQLFNFTYRVSNHTEAYKVICSLQSRSKLSRANTLSWQGTSQVRLNTSSVNVFIWW